MAKVFINQLNQFFLQASNIDRIFMIKESIAIERILHS